MGFSNVPAVVPSGSSVRGAGHGGGAVPPSEPDGAPQDADHGHRHPGGRASRSGERERHAVRHGERPASRPAQGWRVFRHKHTHQTGQKSSAVPYSVTISSQAVTRSICSDFLKVLSKVLPPYSRGIFFCLLSHLTESTRIKIILNKCCTDDY